MPVGCKYCTSSLKTIRSLTSLEFFYACLSFLDDFCLLFWDPLKSQVNSRNHSISKSVPKIHDLNLISLSIDQVLSPQYFWIFSRFLILLFKILILSFQLCCSCTSNLWPLCTFFCSSNSVSNRRRIKFYTDPYPYRHIGEQIEGCMGDGAIGDRGFAPTFWWGEFS